MSNYFISSSSFSSGFLRFSGVCSYGNEMIILNIVIMFLPSSSSICGSLEWVCKYLGKFYVARLLLQDVQNCFSWLYLVSPIEVV